jgi:asparagine synthase (glutamine-hydrolysing)
MLVVAVDRLLGNGEGRIETFTASFGDPRYDEDSFADRIPRRNHWQRHVVRIDADECWDALVRGLWYQEAPFGGVATVAYHKLHAEARKRGVIVLLEAQGADEIFAGYPYFRPAYWRDLLDAGRYQALRSEWRALPREERRKWIDHLRKLLRTGTLAVHYDGTSHLRETGLARDLVQMANGAPDFEAPFSSHLENALWRDTRHTKLPRVLRMNDRLSMASSTELREPFLDHRIVEFAFKLPASQKIRLGQGKYVQRHALRAQLPASVRTEPKRMVVTPQREWFRGSLRRRAEDILSSRSFAERGLFEPKSAQAVFRAFADGQGDNAFFIWQWVNVELWFRTFIDADTRAGSRTLAEVYDDPWKRTTIGETA